MHNSKGAPEHPPRHAPIVFYVIFLPRKRSDCVELVRQQGIGSHVCNEYGLYRGFLVGRGKFRRDDFTIMNLGS
jgi:hypothetical protein